MALASEVVEAPGARVHFFLEPVLVNLEGGRYIVPIPPASLAKLVVGRRPEGGSAPKNVGGGGGGSSGSGNNKPLSKVAATVGSAQVKVIHDAHLTSLSLRDG